MKVYVLKNSGTVTSNAQLNGRNNCEDLIGVYTSLKKAIEAMCDDVEKSTEINSSKANITFEQFVNHRPMDYDERRTIGSASFDFGNFNVCFEYSVYALALDNFIDDEDQIPFIGDLK